MVVGLGIGVRGGGLGVVIGVEVVDTILCKPESVDISMRQKFATVRCGDIYSRKESERPSVR